MKDCVVPKKTNPKIFDGGLQWKDPSPRFIGIDQSYGGFAITSIIADGRYHTEVYEGQGKGVDRLVDIQKFLGKYFEYSENVKNVAMEGYAYGSQMAHMAGELGSLVKLELHHWFYDEPNARYPLIVVPSQVKKYVTGKGMGVKKNQILMHTYKKWGIEFDDDNAADSYALARIAAGMADLAYEKEILKKLLEPKYREKPLP
jgi:crossover junction endodeoxyribonuclease RuvC